MKLLFYISVYVMVGYAMATLFFLLAARDRELPEGSSLAWPLCVLLWPLCWCWAMAYALGLMPEEESRE